MEYSENRHATYGVERIQPVAHNAQGDGVESEAREVVRGIDWGLWSKSLGELEQRTRAETVDAYRSHLSTSWERISCISGNIVRMDAGPKAGIKIRSTGTRQRAFERRSTVQRTCNSPGFFSMVRCESGKQE